MAQYKPFIIGPDGVITNPGPGVVLEGLGDLKKGDYDPSTLELDPFDRANHTGTIAHTVIHDLGSTALKDVGLEPGKVAPGYHEHPCCDADMKKDVYDPTGVEDDMFFRGSHINTQPLSTISDAGQVAYLNVGMVAGTVAEGLHDHPYMEIEVYDPEAHITDAFDRANHTGTQPHTTVTGLGDVALLNVGPASDQVAAGMHNDYHVFIGGGEFGDGQEGLVPKPEPGDHNSLLYGSGVWGLPFLNTFGLVVDAEAVPEMTGCNSVFAGEKGGVPAPQAGDEGKMLTGDGTWKSMADILANLPEIPKESLPSLVGATDSLDGIQGLVPEQPADSQYKVLFGGQEQWKNLNDAIADGGKLDASSLQPMTGAVDAMTTDGAKGVVPQPVAGDHVKLLTGGGTWVDPATLMTAGSVTLDPDMVPIMKGATSGGTKGLAPAPDASSQYSILSGDGSWISMDMLVDSISVPATAIDVMEGASQSTSGAKGGTTIPLAGTHNYVLTGSGEWKDFSNFVGEVGLTFGSDSFPVMQGVSGGGEVGLVPEQPIGADNYILTGEGTWKSFADSIVDSGATLSGESVPLMVPAIGGNPGVEGFAPAPAEFDLEKFFTGSGSWVARSEDTLIWRGDWDNSTAYAIKNVVNFEGTAYVCIQAHTGQATTETAYWDLLAETGIQGVDGPAGVGVPEEFRLAAAQAIQTSFIQSFTQAVEIQRAGRKIIGGSVDFLEEDTTVDDVASVAEWHEKGYWTNVTSPLVEFDSSGKTLEPYQLGGVSSQCVGEAFSVASSTQVVGARVVLRKIGDHGSGQGTITVRLVPVGAGTAGTDGEPGTITEEDYVAQGSIPVSDLTEDFLWYDFEFPSQYTTGINEEYVLIVYPTDIGAADVYVAIYAQEGHPTGNLVEFTYTANPPYISSPVPDSGRDMFYSLTRASQALTLVSNDISFS